MNENCVQLAEEKNPFLKSANMERAERHWEGKLRVRFAQRKANSRSVEEGVGLPWSSIREASGQEGSSE
jgi:hypothetical protein